MIQPFNQCLKYIYCIEIHTSNDDYLEYVILCKMIIYSIPSINPFPNKPVFTCLQNKSFENTAGKGEIARDKQFLLFPQCFQPVWRT